MDSVIKVIDYSLLVAQTYILVRIFASRNSYFKTPFYFFFLITGLFGCLSVVGLIIFDRFPIPEERAWIFKLGYMVNVFGVTGSTIGKMYIVAHRYAVMRHVRMTESIWSDRLNFALCAILLFISFVPCVTIYFCGYRFNVKDNVTLVAYMDDACIVVTKSESCTVYFIFIVVSLVLTPLTSRQLYLIQMRAEKQTKSKILAQQKRMFIIVAVCTLSHLIKAIQQFCWVFTASFHLTEFSAVLASMYSYIHYLATYSASVTLVMFSAPVRRLLINWKDLEKTSPTGSVGMLRSSVAPSTYTQSVK